MGKIFPTKVDWWIGVLLAISAASCFGCGIACFLLPPLGSPALIITGVVCLVFGVWTSFIPWTTNYEVTAQELIVRSAGIRWRIPLASIASVTPTHNPISSPACSLDRLRVDYENLKGKRQFVLISPRETDSFCSSLSEAAPNLSVVDDHLERVQ